ncbi:MAG: tetratricopeptide repeat protein [Pirellulaceae bacterium]
MAASSPRESSPRPQRGRGVLLASAGAALVLGVLALVFWSLASSRNSETVDEPAKPAQPQVVPVAAVNPRGYLGIQACEACHAQRVKEFKETRHYLACMPPDSSQMPAAIEAGEGRLDTSDPTLHFEMVKEGDQYIQKAIRTRADGTARVSSSVVALVYGQGGTADQVYFGWQGNRLHEFPVARLLPQNEWGASKFDRNGDLGFSRETHARCLECHNLWVQQTPGKLSEYDRQGMLLGVTCEKCHGPGRDHVAWHQTNPAAKSAHKIIHPGNLSRESQMAVCGQCHSNAAKYSAEPFSYQPGEPLDLYYKTLYSRFPEDDHVANQDKYLRQSQCYQKSETMTCVTCHNPHHPEEHATPARQKTCLKCHQPESCTDRPNLPPEVREECIGCHMPLVNKVQVHFRTATDAYVPPATRYEHHIGVYPLQRQELLLQWRRMKDDPESREQARKLEQELVRDWIAQGDELRESHRLLPAIDAFRQAQRIHPSPAAKEKLAGVIALQSKIDSNWFQAAKEMDEKKFKAAAETFEGILALKPDLPLVHGKLGSVYASLGQKEKAREHLEAVSRFDPDEPYGEAMLGWLAYLDGRHGEALEHYRRAEEMEPRNVKVKNNRGLAHLGAGQWEEAEASFTKVLALDPKHSGAYQGLSHSLRRQGQHAEAVKNALRAAELTRFENVDILLTLADAYADAGRLSDAQNTASRALAAAQGGNPQLAAQIMARIAEFEKRAGGSR